MEVHRLGFGEGNVGFKSAVNDEFAGARKVGKLPTIERYDALSRAIVAMNQVVMSTPCG
jgi:hypothetical protein